MRRILITGGKGTIGKAVLSKIPQDISVILLSRNSKPFGESKNCKHVIFDPLSHDSIPDDLWNANEVLHMAGATSETKPDLYYTVNTDLTKKLIRLSEINNVTRFIYISSQAVGRNGGHYSNSKFQAEKFLLNSKLNWTILRPSEVYGEGIVSMVSKVCNLVKVSPLIPVIGNGAYNLNPLHIDDLSDFIANLLICNSSISSKKLYTLCGPNPMSFINFCKISANLYNKNIIFIRIPVYLCRLFINLLSFFGSKIIVPDQIDRLFIHKSHDIRLAYMDYSFKPRQFKNNKFL